MDSGLQQLASVRHLRVGELGLQLSQVFQGIRIVFGAVERSAEKQIGVVEQVGLRGGCEKTTEYGQGLFSLIRIDQPLRLLQRRMVCRNRGSRFCSDERSELDASDWPEHAPSKNQHMVPAYRMSIRAMRRRGYQQGGHELLGGVTNTPSARDYYRKPCEVSR